MAFNLRCIYLLWDKATSNDGKRWIPVFFCTMLYMIPMLWRRDYYNYAAAVTSMMAGGLSFIPHINKRLFLGWGHTTFHVILAFHAQILVNSVIKIQ
jgi:hypothetical protein